MLNLEGLKQLRGVGVSRARAILHYKNSAGPIHNVQQLAQVSGLGPTLAADIAAQVTFGRPADTLPATGSDVLVTTGQVVMDSGCRRSVAGQKWHRKTQRKLQKMGLAPVRRSINEDFRFGDDLCVTATCSWIYPAGLFGAGNGRLDIAEIPIDACPALISRNCLSSMDARIDFGRGVYDVGCVGKEGVPLELAPGTGHPVLNICEFSPEHPVDECFLLPGEHLHVISSSSTGGTRKT